MRPRHVVLLTPSVSLRIIHTFSRAQIARETPRIPFFVFKSLRTLSFSVSRNPFICHFLVPSGAGGYENCRVTSFKPKVFPRRALSSLFSLLAPRAFHNSFLFTKICTLSINCRVCTNSSHFGTHYSPFSTLRRTQLLSFHTLAHCFPVYCTPRNLYPYYFQSLTNSLPSQRRWPPTALLAKDQDDCENR